MKELMLHVERIVRPVRATQSRKLRMRRELLSHLTSAMEEERAAGADEAASIEHAKQRLGEPAELTRTLQQSVPRLERVLLGRIGAGGAVDRLERRAADAWGLDRSLTMLHSGLLLLGSTALMYAAVLAIAMQLRPADYAYGLQLDWRLVAINALASALCIWLLVICMKLAAGVAISPRPIARAQGRAIKILTLLFTLTFLYIDVLAGRTVSPRHLLVTLIVGALLVASLLALGSMVRLLRRRYEPWLTLDIAA